MKKKLLKLERLDLILIGCFECTLDSNHIKLLLLLLFGNPMYVRRPEVLLVNFLFFYQILAVIDHGQATHHFDRRPNLIFDLNISPNPFLIFTGRGKV